MILYINACVRAGSRTAELSRYLLSKLDDVVHEVKLSEYNFPTVDEAFIEKRSTLAGKGDFSDTMFDAAKEFSCADTIVVAAPYWDLSFPALLKRYLEIISVVGLTFAYNKEGMPVGVCKSKNLYYITTAGGKILSDEYGFGYVKALAESFYHIPNIYQIKAEGLDIIGADVHGILENAKNSIDRIVL